ncbi:hypothetical protein RND71_036816 [Anisodus tanguticus]|uniref:Uncharacterized protein n=1 Tax=Anisodus tanguticus TaxID=243964 RepID=A0AAE1R4D1_9SOLA|nr:hypothetical protein RND71_036816 [Anisodus tanguticus]
MAMKDCKFPQRPKQKAKLIQRTILLQDLCQERCEEMENKTSKKLNLTAFIVSSISITLYQVIRSYSLSEINTENTQHQIHIKMKMNAMQMIRMHWPYVPAIKVTQVTLLGQMGTWKRTCYLGAQVEASALVKPPKRIPNELPSSSAGRPLEVTSLSQFPPLPVTIYPTKNPTSPKSSKALEDDTRFIHALL